MGNKLLNCASISPIGSCGDLRSTVNLTLLWAARSACLLMNVHEFINKTKKIIDMIFMKITNHFIKEKPGTLVPGFQLSLTTG